MTYNFDIAWDCPVRDFLVIIFQYNLTIDQFIPVGPGGGNPNITVTGSKENIEKFKEHFH
jgi:hypothetical protein